MHESIGLQRIEVHNYQTTSYKETKNLLTLTMVVVFDDDDDYDDDDVYL
jgi:hypothetical protein